MAKRALPIAPRDPQHLGLRTIMDRTLAAAHGTPYVHLSALAIDVDRVFWQTRKRGDLPFGWEVFLTERYLLGALDLADPRTLPLLESLCSGVLDQIGGEPPLGGQIVFAVYDALQRQKLPPQLAALFRAWRSKPTDLLQSLQELWQDADANTRKLARFCLDTELSPQLAPPTRAALQALAQ